MEKNLLIAVVLSIGILFLWNVMINPPPPQPQKSVQSGQEGVQPPKQGQAEKKAPSLDAPGFDEETSAKPAKKLPPLKEEKAAVEKMPDEEEAAKDAPAQADSEKTDETKIAQESEGETAAETKVEKEEPRPEPIIPETAVIETEQFKATFTNEGAKLLSFVLKGEKYSKEIEGSEEKAQIDIVTTSTKDKLPYALLLEQPNFTYDPSQMWKITNRDAKSIAFETTTPEGVTIRKRFTLEEGYMFSIDVEFLNDAKGEASFFPKMRIVGFQDDKDLQSGFLGSAALNMQIPKAYIDGELWEETDQEEVQGSIVKKGQIEWTAIDDRYFLLSIIPPEAERSQITAKAVTQTSQDMESDGGKQTWLAITHLLKRQHIAPGQSQSIHYQAFIGPKEYDTLSDSGFHLEEAVDFWVLGFLAKPMLYVLQYSQKVVGNWGIAILILTALVKLLLHPLTNKSFKSMQKMKDLKPKIDALKEKLGDDKQEFNKQMMELYKREGVNPMGGCLPMLLQMPVFIALYKMLQNSVELYNSPFIPGWINDLVRPDPYYILPVLLGVLMFVQQKLTPTPDSQQQKMMLYMMPAMMFFFMLMLPSGLVLYILANTVLTIIQQWFISKQSEKEKATA